MGLNFVPPSKERLAEILTPSTSRCGLIWEKDLYAGNQARWALIQYDRHSTERGNLDTETDTHGRKTIWRNGERPCEDRDTRRIMPCEDRRRDWRIYKPRIAKNCWPIARSYQEVRKNHHLQVSEGARPCWHLDSGPLLPEPYDSKFLVFSVTPSAVLCYGSPSKWIQWPRKFIPKIQRWVSIRKSVNHSLLYINKSTDKTHMTSYMLKRYLIKASSKS